ncbi:MAG: SigB/SigF/SigG family RNA polymerase sigma factor [Actinobacteria bacterium]|nr:SigB/SigF/SigG family RNA polymerase sigma factor [Actinomycetota bacterium]
MGISGTVSPPFDEELAFRRNKNGDLGAREGVIEQFLPLARRLAARYRHSGESLDDLEQVASLGLIKAVDRYDPGVGAFPRFAMPTISGELKRHFRDKAWGMRVPRHVQERAMRVHKAVEALSTELGRSPTPRDVAAFTGLELEQVLEAMEAASSYTPASLDAPPPGAQGADADTLGETVGTIDPAYELAEWRPAVEPALRDLDRREQEVLRLRFVEGLTQREIGARIDCSQTQVSRLLRATLAKLAAAAEGRANP